MTLEEFVVRISQWNDDAEVWFGDLANHLSNFEIMQLTLGQAAFIVFAVCVFIIILSRK
jgi:hypothetical protein